MKAILFDAPGDPGVLYMGEMPDPQPGPDDLRVRVRATALNRADLLQRRGVYPPPVGASPVLGLEIMGEVEIDHGEWPPDMQRVMGVVTGGGYAETAILPKGMAIPVPAGMSDIEAAAIPEAFLTAYLNLFTLGRLEAGQRVLIHAGASGVGTAAIQLARAAGAEVFATAGTPEKLALCRALGATDAFDYRARPFAEQIADLHLILDFVGAPNWEANLRALAVGGRLMLIGFLGGSQGTLDLGPVLTKSLTVGGTTLRRMPLPRKIALTQEFAAFAMPRFALGELRPVIDSVFPLADAADAHRKMEHNANLGKIVLRVM